MTRKIAALILILAFMAAPAMAQKWDVDVAHSSVSFKVSHLVISSVIGRFDGFTGVIQFDGKDVSTGSVEMEIDVNSVDTDNEKRDEHLKSPDFFDAAKFPKMMFKSKKVIPGEGNNFKLVGDLTIRDVTKEVTFDCVYKGSVDFMGGTKAGFEAKATIDRQVYGLSWSKTLDNGGLMVGNDVDITLELEVNKEA